MKLSLVQDTFFLTEKAKITAYLTNQFEDIGLVLRDLSVSYPFPPEALKSIPKVSKGENYKGMPYLVLDFPRVFGKADVFAFRFMFWWGHFVSASLYLSGSYLEIYKEKFLQNACLLPDNYLISCHADKWVHDLADRHVPVSSLTERQLHDVISRSGFLKVSLRLELNQIEQLPAFATTSFTQLSLLIS